MLHVDSCGLAAVTLCGFPFQNSGLRNTPFSKPEILVAEGKEQDLNEQWLCMLLFECDILIQLILIIQGSYVLHSHRKH